jgi:MoaA/NifB/PqqE/SkfB family radical SAM enzyme
MRVARRVGRSLRFVKALGKAFWSPYHPLLVHLIPMRRCNLACAYCSEYDHSSAPVPTPLMLERVDRIADLGTSAVTLSGGEPLMHPELDRIVRQGRRRGMFVTLNTNGYYLSRARIDRLNRAGLDHLQISIDNVEPDEVSMKSLRLLEPKLRWLSEKAEFTVAINSVIGGGVRRPEDALVVARRARQLGLLTSVGIVHDGRGQLKALEEGEARVYFQLRAMGRRGVVRLNRRFQDNLARGRWNDWSCRAGARYLYVDEHGVVHYCSQQRGRPGIPLERYTREHIRREYDTAKPCAPYCTVNCVQQVSVADNWRKPQRSAARLPGLPARGDASSPA